MRNKLLICLIALITIQNAFATLAAKTLWQVQNGGVDTNGGGFITGATGTDRSNGAAAFCSASDLSLAGGTTLATSITCPFSSASVGNIIQVTAGTNCTTGFYQVVSVTTITATLDRAAGTTSCVAGTFALGGALKTLSKLNTAMGTSNIQQQACVKADSTYSISSAVTFNFTQSAGVFPIIQGYTTTCGDGGQPTIQASTGITSMIILGIANVSLQFENFIIDCNAQASTGAAKVTAHDNIFRNIKAINCPGTFFQDDGTHYFHGERLLAQTFKGTNSAVGYTFATGQALCIDCAALDTSSAGSVTGFNLSGGGMLIRPICGNLSTGSSDCFSLAAQALGGSTILEGVCYNPSRDCVRYTASSASNAGHVTIRNSVMAKPGGSCFNSTNASPLVIIAGGFYEDYNACYLGSGSGWTNWTTGTHDLTLTVDPFINGASDNFAPNNTKNGGNALRRAGYPGALQAGGTGYIDIGAIQHPDPIFRNGVQ